MDPLIADIYANVNNGVYRCGFATGQQAYERAYDALFTTLVRFDAVYHGHFKGNRQKLAEFVNLWGYTRDLFQTPGFGDTVNFDHLKRHYYVTHDKINPTGIVPEGPDELRWLTPHARG